MDIDDIDFIFISRQSLTRAPPPIRLLKQPRACIPITVAIVLIVMFVGNVCVPALQPSPTQD